ncbi:MAG: DUF4394 domain-containing protein [Bryobacteraceae bacterium]
MNQTMKTMGRTAALLTAATVMQGLAYAGDRDDDRRGGSRGSDCSLTIVGLTADQRIIKLKECDPTYPRSVRGISGLTGTDNKIVGIDYRVQDGKLYGVGNAGGIYAIDPNTGVATKFRQLTVGLLGDFFAVDFNPAADALRILSSSGQNLRHPFAAADAATLIDTPTNYTAGTTAMGITAAAYTNNDTTLDTGTMLFNIDSALNQLNLQVPPNAGSLVRVGTLGIDPGSQVGFDIYTTVKNEAAYDNTGYATLVVDGVTRLYEINLLTGRAEKIDLIRDTVVDIALPVEQSRR